MSLYHHVNIGASVWSSSSQEDKKRGGLFHVRVIAKHIKFDMLFDSGSQVNLVSEEVVKKLGLATIPHEKTYPLIWVTNDAQFQVTKKYILKFAISDNFKDEVEFDVVPLDICGIVLGNPYLYDHKTILYREKNQYNSFKDGIEYVIQAHRMKTSLSLIFASQMKMLVNARRIFVLMMIDVKKIMMMHPNPLQGVIQSINMKCLK